MDGAVAQRRHLGHTIHGVREICCGLESGTGTRTKVVPALAKNSSARARAPTTRKAAHPRARPVTILTYLVFILFSYCVDLLFRRRAEATAGSGPEQSSGLPALYSYSLHAAASFGEAEFRLHSRQKSFRELTLVGSSRRTKPEEPERTTWTDGNREPLPAGWVCCQASGWQIAYCLRGGSPWMVCLASRSRA